MKALARKMRNLHGWDLSYAEARELQKRLAGEVRSAPLRKSPGTIAGLDCAFSRDGRRIFAAAVLLKIVGMHGGGAGTPEGLELEHVETVTAEQETRFPYIPGLLSFREAPVCLAAVGKLNRWPDLFMIDGQGIAHPRRLGLASHLGLFFDRPTIGCAKSRLIGTYEEPGPEKGAHSLLYDGDEVIGAVVRTRARVRPLRFRRPQVHAGGGNSPDSRLRHEIPDSRTHPSGPSGGQPAQIIGPIGPMWPRSNWGLAREAFSLYKGTSQRLATYFLYALRLAA
jgi:deoxyribonuclease V